MDHGGHPSKHCDVLRVCALPGSEVPELLTWGRASGFLIFQESIFPIISSSLFSALSA